MLRINRILTPIDFSTGSYEALDVAIEMSRTYQARLDVLYVFQEPALPSFYAAGALKMYGRVPNLEDEARNAMKNLASAIQTPDIEITTHIRHGHPADEIVAFAAEDDSDVIVIATHGLTGLRHVVLGSIAERVVREARCPVFVVKTHGKSIDSTELKTAERLEVVMHQSTSSSG